MFKKLGFETATYPPFCTMSWNILFFFWWRPLQNHEWATWYTILSKCNRWLFSTKCSVPWIVYYGPYCMNVISILSFMHLNTSDVKHYHFLLHLDLLCLKILSFKFYCCNAAFLKSWKNYVTKKIINFCTLDSCFFQL